MSYNLNNIPYTPWLEKTLQGLIKFPVRGICISAVTETGESYVDYYNFTMADKLVISGLIQQDAMLDTLAASGLIEYADEEDESNGEEKE